MLDKIKKELETYQIETPEEYFLRLPNEKIITRSNQLITILDSMINELSSVSNDTGGMYSRILNNIPNINNMEFILNNLIQKLQNLFSIINTANLSEVNIKNIITSTVNASDSDKIDFLNSDQLKEMRKIILEISDYLGYLTCHYCLNPDGKLNDSLKNLLKMAFTNVRTAAGSKTKDSHTDFMMDDNPKLKEIEEDFNIESIITGVTMCIATHMQILLKKNLSKGQNENVNLYLINKIANNVSGSMEKYRKDFIYFHHPERYFMDVSTSGYYEEIWESFEDILSDPKYDNSIQTIYRQKFLKDTNAYFDNTEESENSEKYQSFLSDHIKSDQLNDLPSVNQANSQADEAVIKNYAKCEKRFFSQEKVTDLEILSKAYGLERIQEKYEDYLQQYFRDELSNYGPYNPALYAIGHPHNQQPSSLSDSQKILREIIILNTTVTKIIDDSLLVVSSDFSLRTLFLKIKALQTAWLSIQEQQKVFINSNPHNFFKDKFEIVCNTAIKTLQEEQGLLQRIIYFDQHNTFRFFDEKHNKSNAELADFIKGDLSIIDPQDDAKILKNNLLVDINIPTFKNKFNSIKIDSKPFYKKIQQHINKNKPNFFIALFNSLISYFRPDAFGISAYFKLIDIEKKVNTAKEQEIKNYYIHDIKSAFNLFNKGKINDIQLSVMLNKIKKRYQDLNINIIDLENFIKKFNRTLNKNNVDMATYAHKNNTVFPTYKNDLENHPELLTRNFNSFFKVKPNSQYFTKCRNVSEVVAYAQKDVDDGLEFYQNIIRKTF